MLFHGSILFKTYSVWKGESSFVLFFRANLHLPKNKIKKEWKQTPKSKSDILIYFSIIKNKFPCPSCSCKGFRTALMMFLHFMVVTCLLLGSFQAQSRAIEVRTGIGNWWNGKLYQQQPPVNAFNFVSLCVNRISLERALRRLVRNYFH